MDEDTPKFEPFDPNHQILLFVKRYDPRQQLLEFDGHYIVSQSDRPVELIVKINERHQRASNHPIKLYEEVRPTMVEKIKLKESFHKLELGTGDIIVYTEDIPPEELQQSEMPTPQHYYDHLINSIPVNFRDRNNPKDASAAFTLTLSKKMNYEAFSAIVAKHIGVEPLYVRFVTHSPYGGEGPRNEIKREPEKLLGDILQPNQYTPLADTLYYEKLEIPITEIENKKAVTLFYLTPKLTQEGPYKILVEKHDTIAEVLENFRLKLKSLNGKTNHANHHPSPLPSTPSSVQDSDTEMKDTAIAAALPNSAHSSENHMNEIEVSSSPQNHHIQHHQDQQQQQQHTGTGRWRLIEVYNHKIGRIFENNESVKSISDGSYTYLAEEIPGDQLELNEDDQLVAVLHFSKDPYVAHGTPFLFLLKKGEPFKETHQRLQKKLGLSDKEFEKYKIALVSYSRPTYFTAEDDSTLNEHKFASHEYLGLDHLDRSRSNRSYYAEKAIVFKN